MGATGSKASTCCSSSCSSSQHAGEIFNEVITLPEKESPGDATGGKPSSGSKTPTANPTRRYTTTSPTRKASSGPGYSSWCSSSSYVGGPGVSQDQMYATELVSVTENGEATDSQVIPFQLGESRLTRADGHSLKTDCLSLTDVVGDGTVKAHEVLRAAFMIPPGEESHYETVGVELLYPEVQTEDADRSALEVMLRDQAKQLDERLEKMVEQVKKHREELEDEHARDTHEYLLQKSAHIAKEAAELGVLLCSDDFESHRVIQERMNALAENADSLSQHLSPGDVDPTLAKGLPHPPDPDLAQNFGVEETQAKNLNQMPSRFRGSWHEKAVDKDGEIAQQRSRSQSSNQKFWGSWQEKECDSNGELQKELEDFDQGFWGNWLEKDLGKELNTAIDSKGRGGSGSTSTSSK